MISEDTALMITDKIAHNMRVRHGIEIHPLRKKMVDFLMKARNNDRIVDAFDRMIRDYQKSPDHVISDKYVITKN